MAYADVVLADSPRAYWRLGEASGTSAADSSGNAQTGAYQNTPTLGVTGALINDANTAVRFKRAEVEHVSIPDSNILDLGNILTMEVWLKRAAHSGVLEYILYKGANVYALRINASGAIGIAKETVGTICLSTIEITDTNWHHVVGTKNGSAVKIWIDGLDRTGTVSDQTLENNTAALVIANHTGTTGRALDGTLDEVAVYATALSQARVEAHYNAATAIIEARNLVGAVGI